MANERSGKASPAVAWAVGLILVVVMCGGGGAAALYGIRTIGTAIEGAEDGSVEVHAPSGTPILTLSAEAPLPASVSFQGQMTAEAPNLLTARPAMRAVQSALDAYPPEALADELSRVILAQDLEFEGQTTSSNIDYTHYTIYLNVGTGPITYGEDYVARSLHYNLALIFRFGYAADQFDEEAWAATLPEGFEYDDAATPQETEVEILESEMAEGFVNAWSRRDETFDFASIAEALMMGEPELWDGYARHERFRSKVDLVIAFYTAVHPEMDLAFFEGLRR